jgi:hypothetical protein
MPQGSTFGITAPEVPYVELFSIAHDCDVRLSISGEPVSAKDSSGHGGSSLLLESPSN